MLARPPQPLPPRTEAAPAASLASSSAAMEISVPQKPVRERDRRRRNSDEEEEKNEQHEELKRQMKHKSAPVPLSAADDIAQQHTFIANRHILF